ncbi:unnamed protein product [Phytophthora fragariaefolia]|uniref:Unnamed protein product n=1 Tax=Phytophthora fragariaefolia TaxID=1490495 RepID=A0A9W7D569_9STRA|nr:unnamed protein product [Phytophthora fragariaefolia]
MDSEPVTPTKDDSKSQTFEEFFGNSSTVGTQSGFSPPENDFKSAMALSNNMSMSEFSEHNALGESQISDFDEDLMNRPTNELFEMVRANRNRPMAASQTSDKMNSLEMSHVRRMDELNRIAVDHLGDRISNLDEDMLGSTWLLVGS